MISYGTCLLNSITLWAIYQSGKWVEKFPLTSLAHQLSFPQHECKKSFGILQTLNFRVGCLIMMTLRLSFFVVINHRDTAIRVGAVGTNFGYFLIDIQNFMDFIIFKRFKIWKFWHLHTKKCRSKSVGK